MHASQRVIAAVLTCQRRDKMRLPIPCGYPATSFAFLPTNLSTTTTTSLLHYQYSSLRQDEVNF
jgi:hypothetical protein